MIETTCALRLFPLALDLSYSTILAAAAKTRAYEDANS